MPDNRGDVPSAGWHRPQEGEAHKGGSAPHMHGSCIDEEVEVPNVDTCMLFCISK